jgi:hypothetical protein
MSGNKFDDLPELPEGWRYENSHLEFLVHAVWPGRGAVSLDMRQRAFALGYTSVRQFGQPKYVGRGWKERMVKDAVAQLQKAWE